MAEQRLLAWERQKSVGPIWAAHRIQARHSHVIANLLLKPPCQVKWVLKVFGLFFKESVS